MAVLQYIQVIIPLKLDWEPFYSLPEEMHLSVGDRVRVRFAGAFYHACVSRVGVVPNLDAARIQPIEAHEAELPAVSEREIAFWRILSDYYLCSVGEVYKAAYPAEKNHRSRLKLPDAPLVFPELPETGKQMVLQINAGFEKGKTVLLKALSGAGRTALYAALAADVIRQGKNVLVLAPDTTVSADLEARLPGCISYHSALSPARRKAVAEKLRAGGPALVVGTRSALFLPFAALGLVVVDEEQDPLYKQDAPAPRYHARESAIMLSSIHGSKVLLSSATPSLESIYNARCGRYAFVEANNGRVDLSGISIIDMVAERRKRGMAGCFSLKLLSQMKEALESGGQVLLLGPSRAYDQGKQLENDTVDFFPDARIGLLEVEDEQEEADVYIGTLHAAKRFLSPRLRLVALVGEDGILSRQDFRADERAVQLLEQYRGRCEYFVIQTRVPQHPVFSLLTRGEDPTEQMLLERRQVGYPPYSRMVRVLVRDKNLKRLDFLSRELASRLAQLEGFAACLTGPYEPPRQRAFEEPAREMLLCFLRDKTLLAKKAALASAITAFEQDRKYTGHIILDVDPV